MMMMVGVKREMVSLFRSNGHRGGARLLSARHSTDTTIQWYSIEECNRDGAKCRFCIHIPNRGIWAASCVDGWH